jgi:pimeloyl-ACP methyl ester carboxylesterase
LVNFARGKLRCGVILCAGLGILLAGGCATPTQNPGAYNTVIVVPGIGGDDEDYAGACNALHDAGNQDCLRVYNWGATWVFCLVALWSDGLHHHWERNLAAQITQWRHDHPQARIVIIGHSAGAGVVLGAIADLDKNVTNIGPVILLSPSLSPDYDFRPALIHTDAIHVFYSEWDVVWSQNFPVIFGSYDGAHRTAAGMVGFTLKQLSPEESAKVTQHPWQHEWIELGNPGGHFDGTAPAFVAKILKPLIDAVPERTPQSRSDTDRPAPTPSASPK